MNVNFSYSAYTDLRRVAQDGGCPRKWYNSWVEKVRPEPSEAMLMGSYFEQACLGDSTSKEEVNPPLTKDGRLPAKWGRAQQQAAVFLDLFNPESPYWKGFAIVETQIALLDEKRREKGVYDFFALDRDNNLCRFDLKLTGDLESDWGEFQWADLSRKGWLQQRIYARLWENLNYSEEILKKYQFGTILDYIYVADVSPRMNKKIIPLQITPEGIASVEEHVRRFWDMLEHYGIEGWFEDPSPKECKNCPLRESCSSFIPEEKEEKKKADLYQIFIEETIKI